MPEKVRRYVLKQPVKPAKVYRVKYEDELNAEQLEITSIGDGPMLVIAGAGSGKTRTLTYRVSRLIEDGVDPADILLVTFTNKAAREMLARVEQLVTIDTRRIWGGTLHSIGNRLLRRYAETIGYRSNFSILDDEDAREMMDSSVSSLGIKTLEKRFPKGDVLPDIYSYLINTRTPPARHLDGSAVDFGDRLGNWKLLLAQPSDVAEPLKRRFRSILVDEYQDTNKL